MEILEMPVIEELEDRPQWGEAPPTRLEEQELDIEAFELWREASRPE
jgi:hypothetical protein